MNLYITFLLQMIFWSFFTLAGWLSRGDSTEFHWLLFGVFLYLNLLLAFKILQSKRNGVMITVAGATLYFLVEAAFNETSIFLFALK
ncbi:hypothetical protein JOC78_000200 [Bacillus ectoiniformans]|uniref:hypothetical protein n=1 Tax=Bacillus ectoiniformans TaxID=1494429 RepID=UPI00195C0572|nr:hypothetical protein [Bacillus ectoiniformans]MBM7647279.1 hypothetical protein [Bacillus ectoiniformans]